VKKWAITIAAIVTFPIWILPFGIGLMIWGIYDAIWGESFYGD
jgi:hypothetical protein